MALSIVISMKLMRRCPMAAWLEGRGKAHAATGQWLSKLARKDTR